MSKKQQALEAFLEELERVTDSRLKKGECFVALISPDRRERESFAFLKRCVEGEDILLQTKEKQIAVVSFVQEERSAQELGQFLSQSLYEELGVRARVGLGSAVRSFGEIALSYRQADTALRLSALFHAKGEVHSFREYLLVQMLESIEEEKLKEYVSEARLSGAENVFGNQDLMNTAEEFLENSLNASLTAKKLFMHRNTLAYRLDKIEKGTGLDIRKFTDAVTFRIMRVVYQLLHP